MCDVIYGRIKIEVELIKFPAQFPRGKICTFCPQDVSGWLDPFDLDNVATWFFCATVFFVAFNMYYGGFAPKSDDWWAADDIFL